MAIRRLSAPGSTRCLNCKTKIDGHLRDGEIYKCPVCGKRQIADRLEHSVSLTDLDYLGMRKGSNAAEEAQKDARRELIRRAAKRKTVYTKKK